MPDAPSSTVQVLGLIEGMGARIRELEEALDRRQQGFVGARAAFDEINYTNDHPQSLSRSPPPAPAPAVAPPLVMKPSPDATTATTTTATPAPSTTTTTTATTTSTTATAASDPPEEGASEIQNAATILEFLAWGRRKDPKFNEIMSRDGPTVDHPPGDVSVPDSQWNSGFGSWYDQSPLPRLQMMLPSRDKAYAIARYHVDCILWYHGCFHSARFLAELNDFYDHKSGRIDAPGVDLQWVAVLFAILSSSLTCAPRPVADAWGFSVWQAQVLAKHWFKATGVCLHHADFMSMHSIYSVTAVSILTICAHTLGFSNSHAINIACAIRISQALNLHRLGSEPLDAPLDRRLVDRELGRRIWCQLCMQDWFSVPFTETYLINPDCLASPATGKPLNCTEADMRVLPDSEPTMTSYSRFFIDIARLMPQLQNAMASAGSLYERYHKVLEFDDKMRALATAHLPYYLQNVPIDPSWPVFARWARQSLTISSSHKIMMIHRKYLELSFENSYFERSRRTCVAAARTILREMGEVANNEEGAGPVLWIYHAFSVAASVHYPDFRSDQPIS